MSSLSELGERFKAALEASAKALRTLKEDNEVLRLERDALKKQLEQYEQQFGSLRVPGMPALDMSALERKRKAPAKSVAKIKQTEKKASAVKSVVTTTWGGVSAVAFAEEDSDEDGVLGGESSVKPRPEPKKQPMKRGAAATPQGKGLSHSKTSKPAAKRLKQQAALSSDSIDENENEGESKSDEDHEDEDEDEDEGEEENESESDGDPGSASSDSDSPSSEGLRSQRQAKRFENGWADISYLYPQAPKAPASTGGEVSRVRFSDDLPADPSLQPSVFPVQPWSQVASQPAATLPTVQRLLQGVTSDNFLSCAALLSTMPFAIVAANIQSCLPRIVRSFGTSSFAKSSDVAAAIDALFPVGLRPKLVLIARMLAAIATRTDLGPQHAVGIFAALRLRVVASVRRDQLHPLQATLCGGRSERKPTLEPAEHDIHGDDHDQGVVIRESGDGNGGGDEILTQADFLDSDSDDADEGTNGKEAAAPVSSVSVSIPNDSCALTTEESCRAALVFVLVASCLSCSLPLEVCGLLQDLSFLATGVNCTGTTLGVLSALRAAGGARSLRLWGALLAPHLSHVTELTAQYVAAGCEESAARFGVAALMREISTQLVNELAPGESAGFNTLAPSIQSELSLRQAGFLSSLRRPDDRFPAAFSIVGIGGVAALASTLLQQMVPPVAALGSRTKDALYNPIHDPLLAVSPVDASERAILVAFARHWESALGIVPDSNRKDNEGAASRGTARSASDKLAQVLSQAAEAFSSLQLYFSAMKSDYEVSSGGWRDGPAGKGQPLSERLAERLEHGLETLRQHEDSGTAGAVQLLPQSQDVPLSVLLFEFTSATPARLLQAAELDAALPLAMTTLRADLASLTAAAAIERWHFLTLCSARVLMALALSPLLQQQFPQSKGLAHSQAMQLAGQLASFLCETPCFFCQSSRGDVSHDIRRAASALLALPPLHETPKEISASVFSASQRLPVLLVNLDRRVDRLRRCLLAAEAHGLLLVRVSAVDGRALEATQAAAAAASAASEASISNPLSDVLSQWDTRLNSTFDSACQPDSAAPLTNSERACAASHIVAWRVIQSARQQLGLAAESAATDEASTANGELEAPTAEFRQLAAVYRDSIRGRDDWHLIFEDDSSIDADLARLHGSFQLAVRRVVHAAPDDWDILYLGWAIPWGRAAVNRANDWLLRTNYAWQLHAYVLRGRAVERLLASLPVDAPLDNFVARLVHEGKFVAYAVRDRLVNQDGSYHQRQGDSDINHSARAAPAVM